MMLLAVWGAEKQANQHLKLIKMGVYWVYNGIMENKMETTI